MSSCVKSSEETGWEQSGTGKAGIFRGCFEGHTQKKAMPRCLGFTSCGGFENKETVYNN